MSKASRKDLLNAPDEFITTTSSAVKWIKENPSRFAIAVTIIFIVFASGIGFYHWKTGRESSAMIAYSNAANSSELTLGVIQKYSSTKAAKLSKLRLSQMAYSEKNSKMAVDYAQEFVNGWGRKDTFHWQGIMIMTAAYINEREFDKAMPLLEDCIKNSPANIRDQALFSKSQALIALGKDEEAQKALAEISDSYRDVAAPSLASMEMRQGESINAKQ